MKTDGDKGMEMLNTLRGMVDWGQEHGPWNQTIWALPLPQCDRGYLYIHVLQFLTLKIRIIMEAIKRVATVIKENIWMVPITYYWHCGLATAEPVYSFLR